MAWKHTSYTNNNFDLGHTKDVNERSHALKAAIGEKFEKNFANPFKNAVEKKWREENNGNRKFFALHANAVKNINSEKTVTSYVIPLKIMKDCDKVIADILNRAFILPDISKVMKYQ